MADPGPGATVRSVEASEDDDPAGLVAALGLTHGARPVILVCGGATLGPEEEQRCREVLGPAVRDAAFATAAVVVDGGTDAGVMRVVGQARAAGPSAIQALVGVAPRSKVTLPGENRGGVAVEPHHTQAVLTPGAEFGAERETLFDITAALAGSHNIAVVLAGGGPEARNEALEAVGRGWPLLVLARTGGTADAVAGHSERPSADAEIKTLAEYDRSTVVGDDKPGLAAHLTWTLLRDRPVLKSAWCRFAAYDDAAAAMQKRYVRMLTALLVLGLAATGAAAFQQDLHDVSATAGAVARWGAIVLPTVLVLLVGWNRQRALGKQWVVLRAAAEAIKAETFRYRTWTSPYDGDDAREHELQDRVNLIHRQVISTEVAMTSLPQPAESAPPPNLREEGLGDLDVDRYAGRRIEDQRGWYRRKVREKARARDLLGGATLATGILGTGLAAAGIVPAVAVTTTLATGFAGLLAARQYGEDAIDYNRTAAELDGEFARATRPDADALPEIVLSTEEILVAEVGEWAQRMARALAREERRQAELVHEHRSPD